jgi:transposase
MIAAPVQCDVDGISKGSHYISVSTINDRVRPTQDGRALRRYKRRWVVERFFAWLHNSRRLVTRWERHVENFVALLQLGCMRILLNRSWDSF